MTTTLTSADFDTFFSSVHGFAPFPWQHRLADQVVATGLWPKLVDLPTGTGKTAVLDVAVFSLALRRDLPRRIAFVVDRRLIVHQAAQRARVLAEALADPRDDVVRAVSDQLRALAPDPDGAEARPVLHWSELRGGIVRDESWALRPDVPAVLLSTVDQIGSRLLFRGYGVTRGMQPVHAGLVGNDTLVLLDEVHLARPFRSTLAAIGDRYRDGTVALPDRWQVTELSATPSERPPEGGIFSLDDDDVDAAVTPVLHRRLAASKPAVTRLVPVTGKDEPKHRAALVKAGLAACTDLLGQGVRTVGVVVNRVATAVAIQKELEGKHDARLLTGRMRPLDRDDLLDDALLDRIMTGRVRSDEDEPLVLVSTQAIEAGADLDLDALVTECAPIDALRQRFGRVDRDGQVAAAGQPSTSVILATSASVAPDADDPVYGGALAATWAALQDRPLDFGFLPVTLGDLDSPGRLEELTVKPEPAPQLLPSHLDRWVQTSNPPHADPVPAHWLHGLDANVEDITVVWRADLEAATFQGESAAVDEVLTNLLAALPVSVGETMAVSTSAVKSWLVSLSPEGGAVGGAPTAMADVDRGSPDQAEDNRKGPRRIAPVAVVTADGAEAAHTAGRLRPGSTIVVPADYGGISHGTWDPTSAVRVADMASRAAWEAKGRLVVRLTPEMLGLDAERLEGEPDPTEERVLVDEWLRGQAAGTAGMTTARGRFRNPDEVVMKLAEARRSAKRVVRVPRSPWRDDGVGDSPLFVVSMQARRSARPSQAGDTVDSEPETSSFTGRTVELGDHLGHVEDWARQLATSLDLPPEVIDDLALAGRLHDLGKADPRFQIMVRDGGIAPPDTWLAKSATGRYDRRARLAAARAAGYPPGTRHEMLSVAMIAEVPELEARAHDWELVLHLVASHHGYARPFTPVAVDAPGVSVAFPWDGLELRAESDHQLSRVDSGVPERFWRMTRQYGWWGLAWLEAVLRLADHRASAAEQLGSDDDQGES